MAKVTELGVEVFPGITIPWDWLDGIICGVLMRVANKGGSGMKKQEIEKLKEEFRDIYWPYYFRKSKLSDTEVKKRLKRRGEGILAIHSNSFFV